MPVAFPQNVGAAEIEFYLMHDTQIFQSPITKSEQRLTRPNGRWVARLTYPPLTEDKALQVIAAVDAAKGAGGTFTLYNPAQRALRGVGTGTPVIKNRINKCLWSEQADNAYWTKVGIDLVTPNATISPDGTVTADELRTNLTTGNRWITRSFVKAAASQAWNISCRFKAGTYAQVKIQAGVGANFANIYGTLGSAFASQVAGVGWSVSAFTTKALSTPGWYEVSCTVVTGTEASIDIAYGFSGTTIANDTIYAWGMQADTYGSGPSSYVMTEGAEEPGNGSYGSILYTDGWTPSTSNIVKAGDLIGTDVGSLFRVTADVDSTFWGNADIPIAPQIRVAPTNSSALVLTDAPVTMRLLDDSQGKLTINQIGRYGIDLNFIEPIPGG